ncbi:MAG: hypothetical protein ABW022_11045 [Actinoplanes sp.]
MRKINWDEPLSEEDIAWLRTTGILGIEDRIARNAEEHGGVVPEEEIPKDEVTRDGLSAASALTPAPRGNGAPELVDPTKSDPQDDEDEGDDYDQWKVTELETEVAARTAMANTSDVVVEGTGANGKVTKADLIKGLRLWDVDNPDALKE